MIKDEVDVIKHLDDEVVIVEIVENEVGVVEPAEDEFDNLNALQVVQEKRNNDVQPCPDEL